jgi:tripartite-type tricarboxylate transporter receptor subunit TctC
MLGAPLVPAVAVAAAAAPAFPSKPIRILVPSPTGGGTDAVARIVAQRLSAAVGQSTVIDNRSGASGNIAAQIVAKATADGYTLLVIQASHTTNPSLFKDLGFDAIRDFAPITRLSGLPYLLVVTPSLPVKNVKELIALAKSTKGGITYASAGTGLLGHLSMELLKEVGGFDGIHVAYKGGAVATIDVASGRVCCFFASAPSAQPFAASGRVRVIAVSTKERSPLVPDVPTVAEQGFPDFDVVSWYGMLAPAGTPKPVVALLHREIAGLLRTEDIRRQMNAIGAAPEPSASPEAFKAFLEAELAMWRKVIQRAGITAM